MGFTIQSSSHWHIDTSLYESLFKACRQGDVVQFCSALASIRNHAGWPNPLQPAACLAAQKHQVAILRLCLNEGALFDAYLDKACHIGASTAPMLDLLFEQNWRGIRDQPGAMENQIWNFREKSFARKWFQERAGVDLPEADDWIDLASDGSSISSVSDDEDGDEPVEDADDADDAARNIAVKECLERIGPLEIRSCGEQLFTVDSLTIVDHFS
jgi:hypothetical protein